MTSCAIFVLKQESIQAAMTSHWTNQNCLSFLQIFDFFMVSNAFLVKFFSSSYFCGTFVDRNQSTNYHEEIITFHFVSIDGVAGYGPSL